MDIQNSNDKSYKTSDVDVASILVSLSNKIESITEHPNKIGKAVFEFKKTRKLQEDVTLIISRAVSTKYNVEPLELLSIRSSILQSLRN